MNFNFIIHENKRAFAEYISIEGETFYRGFWVSDTDKLLDRNNNVYLTSLANSVLPCVCDFFFVIKFFIIRNHYEITFILEDILSHMYMRFNVIVVDLWPLINIGIFYPLLVWRVTTYHRARLSDHFVRTVVIKLL